MLCPVEDIRNIGIFAGLTEKEAEGVAPRLVPGKYRRKDTIFSEGDPSEWFYFVEKGEVKITKISLDGKEIILEIIHPGDFFGGLAVLRGFPYPANAVAKEDSEVLKISRADLMKVVEKHPNIMLRIVQEMGDRIKHSHETTKNIALEKVSARIAALLLKLARESGTPTERGVELGVKLTKQEIAEMVGTTVETSIRTMSHFKKMGLIEERAGKIIIRDATGLEAEGT